MTREQQGLRVLRLVPAPNSRKESNAKFLLPSLSSHSTLVSFLITTGFGHHPRKIGWVFLLSDLGWMDVSSSHGLGSCER